MAGREKTSIWYSREPNGSVMWNYSYVIKRTKCLDVGNRNCTKTYRVR